MERKTCPMCGVKKGEFHASCDREECPFCHNQLISCECVLFRLLDLNQDEIDSFDRELTPEELERWDEMLKKKGLIPFGQEKYAKWRLP